MNKKLILISTLFVLSSCGGSGSGASNTETSQTVFEGVFIDSPVMGLAYSTATQSGLTDSRGTFTYLAGETVRFTLAGIDFGSALGGDEITPLNLVGAANFDEASSDQREELTNILILLQSLDADQNPENGIDLANLDTELGSENIDFKMPVEEFTAGRYLGLVADAGGRVIEGTQALNHFFESIDATISIELPSLLEQDFDGDGVIDSETVYEYTAEGQPLEARTRTSFSNRVNNTAQTYEYRADGLLISLTNSSIEADGTGTTTAEQSFEYNDQGQLIGSSLVRADRPTAVLTRTYDEFGRLERQEKSVPRRVIQGIPFTPFGGTASIETAIPSSTFIISGSRGGSLITPNDLALFFSGIQAPLNLSIPSLFGDFFAANLEFSFSGHNINLEQFEYSEQGHVESILNIESILEEDSIEPVIQSRQTRTYDSEGRLLLSVVQAFESQIESLFSFADNGRLQSCSVVVDDEVLVMRSDPITEVSGDNEDYQYIGRCSGLIGTLTRFNEDGALVLIENYFPSTVIDSPPVVQVLPPRVSRLEVNADDNGDLSVRTTPNIEESNVFIDQVTSRVGSIETSSVLNSMGEQISTRKITFETFELDKLPLSQINIGPTAIANISFSR